MHKYGEIGITGGGSKVVFVGYYNGCHKSPIWVMESSFYKGHILKLPFMKNVSSL
jgi:hypothetical protein